MTDLSVLNELYNILDLYIVASRFEGGPQSIYECALTKTPIISTDVGVANLILSENSIFDMNNYIHAKPDIEIAHRNLTYLIENSMKRFRTIMEDSLKISIGTNIQEGPWGGGNLFAINFKDYLEKEDIRLYLI